MWKYASIISIGWIVSGGISTASGSLRTSLPRSLRAVQDAAGTSPVPVPFPATFLIDFVTNITWSSDDINNNEQDDWMISGRLYYDWTQKIQRIDHGPGSYECLHFYDYHGPCSLVFIPGWGMYRILLPSTTSMNQSFSLSPSLSCCLDIPNIGAPPPDWAEQGNPTYNGIVWDSFSNSSAHEWIYDQVLTQHQQNLSYMLGPVRRREVTRMMDTTTSPAEQYHTTRQAVGGTYKGRPLLFTFPSANGTQDYHYRAETMIEMDVMDASIFSLPDGCQTQFCKCDDDEVLKNS